MLLHFFDNLLLVEAIEYVTSEVLRIYFYAVCKDNLIYVSDFN
jgi:hypothetical protein